LQSWLFGRATGSPLPLFFSIAFLPGTI